MQGTTIQKHRLFACLKTKYISLFTKYIKFMYRGKVCFPTCVGICKLR